MVEVLSSSRMEDKIIQTEGVLELRGSLWLGCSWATECTCKHKHSALQAYVNTQGALSTIRKASNTLH